MKNHFISATRQTLFDTIDELSANPSLFIKNPGRDFTRKRKLDFGTFMRFTLGMSGRSSSIILTYCILKIGRWQSVFLVCP